MKKIVVLLLVLFTVCLSVPVSAASASLSDIIHDEIIQLIDIKQYGADPSDEEIYLISVMESGYTEKGFTDQTALYVYLYNPFRKDLSDSALNTIQIATKYNADGQPTDFKKYPLVIEGTTSGGLYARAKVNIKAKDLAYVRDGARWYGITEFEIYDGRVYNAKTHPCGYVYKFSGSGKTLSCELESFLTVELDVGFTSYLTSNSAKGLGYFNQIASVYFSIPDWIEKEYGKLYGVSYEYYKYRTAPIVLCEGDVIRTLKEDKPFTWNENLRLFLHTDLAGSVFPAIEKMDIPVLIAFDVDDLDSDARHVSSADLESAFLNHFTSNPSSIEDKVLGLYHKELFTDDYSENNHKVSDYRTRSEIFNMDSYGDKHEWWEKLLEYGLLFGLYDLDENIQNAKYIQPISTASFGIQDFSSAFLVDDADISALQAFVRSAEDNRENTYLLRFAHTDNYYASAKKYYNASYMMKTDLYVNNIPVALVQEDVYLGFDIIKLDFSDDGKEVTTFGVVSSPLNIFPSFDDVFTGTGDDVVDKGVDLSWLYKLAAVLLIGALGFSVIWVIDLFGQLGEASTNRQILRELRRKGGRKR